MTRPADCNERWDGVTRVCAKCGWVFFPELPEKRPAKPAGQIGSEPESRLRRALEQIAAIKDKMVGGDWDEIDEARAIAIRALSEGTP